MILEGLNITTKQLLEMIITHGRLRQTADINQGRLKREKELIPVLWIKVQNTDPLIVTVTETEIDQIVLHHQEDINQTSRTMRTHITNAGRNIPQGIEMKDKVNIR